MSEPGRNDPCPCGSGLKYKKCCWGKPQKRLKFKAKVIQSVGASDLSQKVKPETKPFEMTKKDYRLQK